MKIFKPKSKDDQLPTMLRVEPEGMRDLSRLTQCPFPFKQNADDGTFLIHISTVERFMVRGWVTGADTYARGMIKAYSHEIKLSFTNRDAPQDADVVDLWLPHLDARHFEAKPYQIMGMQRIYERMVNWGVGQILADDVGLGKTPQTIGVLSRMRSEGLLRGAIVATTLSTQHQWAEELGRMANPKLKVVNILGTKQQRLDKFKIKADVYIVNHATPRYDHYWDEVKRITGQCDLLIIDESSAIKNPTTKTHERWYEVSKRMKWSMMLNATAIENNLTDLWTNARFVDVKNLGNHAGFDKRYVERTDSGTIVGSKNLKELRKRIALSMYRRTAKDVGEQLPEVRTQMRKTMLTGKQKKYYETCVGESITEGGNGAIAFSRLAKVQRAALGSFEYSAKIDDLKELLEGDLSGERIVIFTRFKECVKLAEAHLKEYKPMTITGDTHQRERANTQRRFASQHGAGRVLICTEAADRGLNLQAAGVVVNLDLPWTAAKLRQRIGRINRVNQTRKSILVINCIAEHPKGGTIDEYMCSVIIPKRELFRDVLGDSDVDELGNENIDPQAVNKYIAGVLKKTGQK